MADRVQAITPGSNHASVEQLGGFSIEEDSSAAAQVVLRKGSVSGTIFWHLNLTADQSASIMFPRPIATEGGVYVQEVSGSIAGVLFDAS